MSYLATYTDTNGTVTIIGDYWTLADACTACQSHLSLAWDEIHGPYKALDPNHAYDRGQFSQWGGRPRLYASMPNGDTAHYDIAELSRNAGDKGSEN